MKRVLIIAVVLEGLKYAFAGLVFNLPESIFSFVFAIIFYIWFLPELMIGGEHLPHHWYTTVARLGIGVLWNLPAALYIAKCLFDDEAKSPKKQIQA